MKLGLNGLAELWVKNNPMAKIKMQVFGKVQGVFFRHSARQQALSLNLTGWIKNIADGSVLCEAEGDEKSLLEFVAWCKRGTASSKVDNVTVQWLDDSILPQATGFEIIR